MAGRLAPLRLPGARDTARVALRALMCAVGLGALTAYAFLCWRIVQASVAQPALFVPSGHNHFPAWLQGPLRGSAGHTMPVHQFVRVLVALTVLYVVVVVCARAIPAPIALTVVGGLTVLFALAPPLLSNDVFNYIAYSRAAQLHGFNPYVHGPAVIANDPVYPFVGHLWNHTPSAYGPLFTLLTYELEPLGIHGELWALKGIAAAASLGCVALVWMCARRLDIPRLPAALFFGLNPLVLVWAVGGAHNDLLMVFVLLVGVYLLLSRRPALGGAALATAAAVKLTAGLALPFALVGVRPRWKVAAGALGASALLFAITYAEFGSKITGMLDALKVQSKLHFVVISVPGYAGYVLGHGAAGTKHTHLFTGFLVAGVGLLLLRTLLKRSWLESSGWALLLLLVTSSWLLPWYVVWLLPIAALARKHWLEGGAVALTGVLVAMQITHFVNMSHHHHHVRHHHGVLAARHHHHRQHVAAVGPVRSAGRG